MTTSWEDQDIFCDNDSDEHATQECDRVHPSIEIIPDRYAFWVIGHRAESLYLAGRIADFRTEVELLLDDEPATVRDLLTGAEMDAAQFLAPAA